MMGTTKKPRLGAREEDSRDGSNAPYRDEEDSPLLVNVDAANTTTPQTNDTPRWVEEERNDFAGLPWWKTPSIWWLIPGFFIYALAFGGIVVPRLNLVLTLVCRDYLSEQAALHPELTILPVVMFGDNPQCRIPAVQKLATQFTLYMSLIAGLLAAFSSPKLGEWSDLYGRKFILCVTIFGGLVGEMIIILCATYPDTVSYHYLLLAAFCDGVCGTFIAAMAIVHSYASDCTTPAKRAVAFGYFHACLFGGIAIGPFMAAWFTKTYGNLMYIFWLAFWCHSAFIIYLFFFVPESLSKKRQLEAREKRALERTTNPAASSWAKYHPRVAFAPLKVLYPTDAGPATTQIRTNLLLLAGTEALIFGVAMGSGPVLVFYANYTFEWGDFETQIFVGATSASRVLGLVFILPALNYLFRVLPARRRAEAGKAEAKKGGCDNLDLWTIRLPILLEILGTLGFALTTSATVFFACGVFSSLGGIATPILQSALTKHVPPAEVGRLLGAMGLLHALGRVVCPVVFSTIYAGTVAWWPGAVFWVLAGAFAGAMGCGFFIRAGVELPWDARGRDEVGEEGGEGRYTDEERRERRRWEEEADELRDEEVVPFPSARG